MRWLLRARILSVSPVLVRNVFRLSKLSHPTLLELKRDCDVHLLIKYCNWAHLTQEIVS